MRKVLRGIVESDFYKALDDLGYEKILLDKLPSESYSEWRRERFHLIIRVKNKINLSIHEDFPRGYPPWHRARTSGKHLSREFNKIIKVYKKVRTSKMRLS